MNLQPPASSVDAAAAAAAMSWITTLTGYLAPVFIVLSPIISYSDQVLAMHRSKSSAGFSLDIPLIMLVASFLRCDLLFACPRSVSTQQ